MGATGAAVGENMGLDGLHSSVSGGGQRALDGQTRIGAGSWCGAAAGYAAGNPTRTTYPRALAPILKSLQPAANRVGEWPGHLGSNNARSLPQEPQKIFPALPCMILSRPVGVPAFPVHQSSQPGV